MKATTPGSTGSPENEQLKKVLLICGILSSLLYVGTDIIAGMRWEGYSFTSQFISELFAIGAPTSGLVVPLFTVSNILLIAFALCVWMLAGRNRALRVTALMVVGNAINGLTLWNFFPMHMRGAEATFTDTMHLALAGVGVIFVLLALVFGAAAFRNWFRPYSAVAILILLVPSGIVAFFYAPQVAANLPTPWGGLAERISTYGWDLWVVLLAIALSRAEKVPGSMPDLVTFLTMQTDWRDSPVSQKGSYSDYFDLNRTIMSVLSLFAGFLFTSITILLNWFQGRAELVAQATVLFLTLVFYLTLYVLLDNLEMGFHYVDRIPPLTLKVKPFFYLLVIFYLFGAATSLMFLLHGLQSLAFISGVIWAVIVIISIRTTARRFYQQSVARDWTQKT